MKDLQKDSIDRFADLIAQGVVAWYEAGKIAAEEIKRDPTWIDAVCERIPGITPQFIRQMEWIGLRKIHPMLLISGKPGPEKLKRLPYELQERYLSEPVTLVIRKSADETTIIQVDINNLTADQAQQVFGPNGVRSEAEQRAWLEDRALRQLAPEPKVGSPYRIERGKLLVLEPCSFTVRDLTKLLAQLTQ